MHPANDYRPGDRVRVVDDTLCRGEWLGRTGAVRRVCASGNVYVLIDDGPREAVGFEPLELERVSTGKAG